MGTLAETLGGLAARGDAVALHTPDLGVVTYARLADRAERLAGALLALGISPGERLAFLLPNGSRIVECYLACARTGIIGVPLSVRATSAELVHQLRDSEAVALLFAEGGSELVEGIREHAACPGVVIDTDADSVLGYEDLLEAATTPDCPLPAPESTFCVMYTGGTTGESKAALQTQRSWAASIRAVAAQWELTNDDRHVAVLPMDHVSWFSTASMLFAGGETFIHDGWDPERVVETVQRERVTVLNMIPTMFGDLLGVLSERPEPRVGSLRLLTVAGSPMPVEMYERGVKLVGPIMGCIYGMTESSGPVSFLLPKDLSVEHLRSGGRPGPGIELAILGPDGEPTDGSEPGEIGLKGAQMTAGYLNQPEATSQAFRDGWFLTGDVGRVDEAGFLYIVDRSKDMVKSGGFNVYPREVEDALYTNPDVLEAAVVGVPDPRWIEAVVAGVVLAPGSSQTAESLRDHCRDHLPRYKVPKAVHIEDRLPRTKVGKFDKRALRERFSRLTAEPREEGPPHD